SEPEIQALHAGLECGVFAQKIPGLDCVSFGPNMFDIHTTKERLSLSSAERVWNFILKVLQ
ncbi:MAG: aminoacyl-histidine dipeptidase, partial [Lachnospiraceae bacterium]|nr:aminoacyl-histidine dipeptidase [Lachnospiraceae bacterium]